MLRRTTGTLLLAFLALVVVGGAIPASAKPPAREVFRNEGWFTLPDITCDGFTLTEEMDSESVQVTTYFNQAGDPIKESIKANFFGTITNSVSQNTYRDHATFTETYDLVSGTTTVSGQSYHYVVKGKGQVFAEVGHKIMLTETGEVTFQGGQDDLADDPDLLSLCDSLV